jgi:hypothetical protein
MNPPLVWRVDTSHLVIGSVPAYTETRYDPLDEPSWFLGHERHGKSGTADSFHNPFHGKVSALAENLL